MKNLFQKKLGWVGKINQFSGFYHLFSRNFYLKTEINLIFVLKLAENQNINPNIKRLFRKSCFVWFQKNLINFWTRSIYKKNSLDA